MGKTSDNHFGLGNTTRRQVLGGSLAVAGGAAASSFPYISRARAAGEPLKFWQFYAPGGLQPGQSKWFEDMVKSWNDQNDVKVQLEYIPNGDYMDGTKLPTAFASGQGPDIFIISPGDFLRYYNGGVLLDLTPYVEAKAKADFPAGIMGTRMVDGKIYGIPMEVEPMAMYYSVEAFEKAKLNENDIPKTWDQLLDVAKKLTDSKRYGVLFESAPGYYQNFTWYPFLWQAGGEIAQGGKSAFNGPGTIQALKFWQDAVKSGVCPRKPLGGGAWDSVPNLASGFCAMQNVGIWAVSQLKDGAPNFKYDVFKLPIPDGGKYATVGGGWAFVANAKGKNPEGAAKFCVWALGSMNADSVQRVVDWCTNVKSDMPPRLSAFDAGKAAYDAGFLKKFKDDIYPGTRGEPRLPPQVYKFVSDAIQACQLNGQDPAGAAAAASQQIDAFLAAYKGAPLL
jgi:multiple sugar transport system substrate-binding protein